MAVIPQSAIDDLFRREGVRQGQAVRYDPSTGIASYGTDTMPSLGGGTSAGRTRATTTAAPQRQSQLGGIGALVQAMQRQQTAGGGALPTRQAQFQDPQQLARLIGQMNEMLQPYTDARVASSTAEYNRAMQNLRNQLAAQGALVGGGAVSQQMDETQRLARYLDEIRAQQNAQAIALGLEYGDLGLRESDLIFNQADRNRMFEYERAQQAFQNLLAGLSLEEDSYRFDYDQWATEDRFGRNLAEQARQFDADLRERERQTNLAMARDLSSIFGVAVAPKATGQALFDQILGRQTAQMNISQAELANALQRAQLAESGAMARAMLPWTQGLTPYEQAYLSLQRDQLNASGQQIDPDAVIDNIRREFGTNIETAAVINSVIRGGSYEASAYQLIQEMRRVMLGLYDRFAGDPDLVEYDGNIFAAPPKVRNRVIEKYSGIDFDKVGEAVLDIYR